MIVKVNNFVISSEDDALSDLSIDGEQSAEVVAFPRSDEVELFDRHNNKTSIRFKVTRKHDTLEDAREFILMHATQIPGLALVTLINQTPNGGYIERYLRRAMVTSSSGSHMGVTTFFTYQIVGGKVWTTPA